MGTAVFFMALLYEYTVAAPYAFTGQQGTNLYRAEAGVLYWHAPSIWLQCLYGVLPLVLLSLISRSLFTDERGDAEGRIDAGTNHANLPAHAAWVLTPVIAGTSEYTPHKRGPWRD